MKVWLDTIALSKDENHLVGAITHPAVQEFSKLQGPIQNDILDGKMQRRRRIAAVTATDAAGAGEVLGMVKKTSRLLMLARLRSE